MVRLHSLWNDLTSYNKENLHQERSRRVKYLWKKAPITERLLFRRVSSIQDIITCVNDNRSLIAKCEPARDFQNRFPHVFIYCRIYRHFNQSWRPFTCVIIFQYTNRSHSSASLACPEPIDAGQVGSHPRVESIKIVVRLISPETHLLDFFCKYSADFESTDGCH